MALAVRRERDECAALSGAPSSPLPALLGVPPLPALDCVRAVRLSAAEDKLARRQHSAGSTCKGEC